MKEVYGLEFPHNVALETTVNDSLFIVLLFSSPAKSEYFYNTLINGRECDLNVFKEDNGNYTFIFRTNISPQDIVIKSDRNLNNTPKLSLITNPDYQDYSYLTCGFLEKEKVFYPKDVSYPLFLRYS